MFHMSLGFAFVSWLFPSVVVLGLVVCCPCIGNSLLYSTMSYTDELLTLNLLGMPYYFSLRDFIYIPGLLVKVFGGAGDVELFFNFALVVHVKTIWCVQQKTFLVPMTKTWIKGMHEGSRRVYHWIVLTCIILNTHQQQMQPSCRINTICKVKVTVQHEINHKI